MKQPELVTKRLKLRSFALNDASEIKILAGNYNVSKTTLNIPYPYETGMAEEWIGTHEETWNTKTRVVYAITKLEDDQLIGAISLLITEGSDGKLGYWIGESYWGKGYCTEAATALIQFSFEKLGLNIIIADHLTMNPASGHVMEKAGMHPIGSTVTKDRHQKDAGIEIYEIRNTQRAQAR